jgi:hypothetical protein
MAQNDFLEGIRKGMQAYLQTRSMMQQYQGNQLQQETYKMQRAAMERQQKDYRSPEEKADFDLKQHEKKLELGRTYEDKVLQAKIERSKMTVNELNREHPGMFYVDENGSVQQIKEKVISGGHGVSGDSAPKPMTFKDAMSTTNELFSGFGIENPQQTPVFNKVLGLVRSDNYEAAQATLRVYAIVPNTRLVGVKRDFQYTLPTGEKVDPQDYATYMAMSGESDEAIKAMLDDAAKQAQASGALPIKKNMFNILKGDTPANVPSMTPSFVPVARRTKPAKA